MSKEHVVASKPRDSKIDILMWKWYNCREYEECVKVFKDIVNYLADNWIYLVSWSGFEAWGKYYVSPDRKRCIYIGANPRTDPVTRWVNEIKFNDPAELANKIWLNQKGVITFSKIKKSIKNVFGVDVEMDERNRFIRLLFGEAGEQ
jgi:hypothetical protein